ncbi:MAG: radical SAM protein [Granulosicoccaceae bacterium]
MKVLIANPAVRRQLDNGLERYMMGSGVRFPWSLVKKNNTRPRFSMFPMFLGFTAAILENEGFEVFVIDGVPLDLHNDEFLEKAIAIQPDIIITEPNSAVIDDVMNLQATIKAKTNAISIVIGSHISAEVHSVSGDWPSVDYAVMGEYEYGVRNLLTALRESSSVENLKGIAYRVDGKLKKPAELAPAVTELDELPLPARHLFPAYFNTDMNAYNDGFNQYQPTIDVHSSRGCPYRCNFCVWVQVLFDNGNQRLRSPAKIAEEMEYLVEHFGAKEIYFDDDNFTANKKHVHALCDELISRNSKIPWSALTDAIALNEDMLNKMAAAGCIGIKFGLDSADSEVLEKSNKPLKVSRVPALVKRAIKLGIKTHMTVVLGLSGETKASLNRTFKFSCELDIDSIQYSMATPIPGTALYKQLEKEQKMHFVKWEELDGYSSSVIKYDDFSREYLEDFEYTVHSRWLRARLKHPAWVLRQTKYLARLTRIQGLPGFVRRVKRGAQLLKGDSIMVKRADGDGHQTSIRW